MENKEREKVEVFGYFKKLETIRKRATLLLNNPAALTAFDVHLDNLPTITHDIVKLIKRDYASPAKIPAHSRWRHFEAKPLNRSDFANPTAIDGKCMNRIKDLMAQMKGDQQQKVVGLLDLFIVSVLLDAGAGADWKYVVQDEFEKGIKSVYNRSEGLGIASLALFKLGKLSSTKNPYQCDSTALQSLTPETLSDIFQVSSANPLIGIPGRCALLNSLGKVCDSFPEFFKRNGTSRPGNLVYYLLEHSTTTTKNGKHYVHIDTLWTIVMDAFSGIWPASRTKLHGKSLGDVWTCDAFEKISDRLTGDKPDEGKGLVSFHKLSQWLTYSMMEPLGLIDIEFLGDERMTGLAEYRNGGLFVDYAVLTLKPHITASFPPNHIPKFSVDDQVVVEWRALTIALLDLTAASVRKELGMTEKDLPLVKVLEAGTWKLGREIAAAKRPGKNGPPIEIESDGTVF